MTEETPEPLVLTDNVGERIKALHDLRKIAEREKAEADRASSAAKVRIADINDELRQIVDLPDERKAAPAAYADLARSVGIGQLGQAGANTLNPFSGGQALGRSKP